MRALRLLFSPSGRLERQAFVFAAVGVYAAGVVSQWLTGPGIMAWGGVWPFATVQVVLIWIWFSLHAKRLHDADRSAGVAGAAAIVYFLAVMLLLFLLGTFFGEVSTSAHDLNATSALTLILFIWIVAILSGTPGANLYWLGVLVLVAAALPIIFTVAVTLWAATRPSMQEQTT
ncbi:MAG: hypothetical protein WB760_15030 [Xanthobacteraceae bacterium]